MGSRHILLALIVAQPFAMRAAAQARHDSTRILMVYSHNPNAPGVVAFAGQLKAVVREEIITGEIYDEYLDVDRFPYSSHAEQFAHYLADKYRRIHPNVIVAEGSPALKFVVEHLLTQFEGVPVVYGGAFEPIVDYSSLPPNVVGRHQKLPFAPSFTLARALEPDAKRVVVVGGASPTDTLLIEEARRQITPLLNGMPLATFQDWSYQQLLDSLRHIAPHTLLLFSDFSRDQQGAKFIPGDLIASLASVASVPTFGIARNWVGAGIVGGAVMDFGNDGTRTAMILMRVLGRSRGDPMPPSEVSENPLVVDWRELQRWGLSERDAPAGTEVLFRPVPLWQRYRGAILIVMLVLLAESVLIWLLLIERTHRRRAQRVLAETREQVAHLGRVATLNGLAAAVSHEMRQPLSAIRLNAAAGELLLARQSPDVAEALTVVRDIARDVTRASDVMEQFRALQRKRETETALVDVGALCRATAKLMAPEAASRGAHLEVQLDANAPPVHGDPVQLQQAIINLTLNALEALPASSAAREVGIQTVARNGTVEVRVWDTGPGLSPEAQARLFEPFFSTKPHGLGMGVTIVRSIAERHHGSLRVVNRAEGGALFSMILPSEETGPLRGA